MTTKQKIYWFSIRDGTCIFDKKEFFVKAESAEEARKKARNLFIGIHVVYYGRVSEYFAINMGLDTY